MKAERPAPFEVCGPLPGPGITVLEASAGTGKTFTIAALAARFIAEGVPVDRILAVTFTRMATAELRDRVRARLVSAERALSGYLHSGDAPADGDDVARLLATGPRPEVEERHARLSRALAAFDAATITTTHGFCELVLAGLGVAGRVAIGAALTEDTQDLVAQTVDDVYARRVLRWGQAAFGVDAARQVAAWAVANPDTPLVPPPGDTGAGRRRRFADLVRSEVDSRLLNANLLTFDGLLIRLRDTLSDPLQGPPACHKLADRYEVVLVDEFQDTDPVQWEAVRQAFGAGDTTLVLIGDPKQAIYAFRGADVYSYLEALKVADRRYTLAENWRSDEGLITALDALFDPLQVGHPDIVYRKVRPPAAHGTGRLEGAPCDSALRARVVHTRSVRIRTTSKGWIQKDAALSWVAGDVAADIAELLGSPATLPPTPGSRLADPGGTTAGGWSGGRGTPGGGGSGTPGGGGGDTGGGDAGDGDTGGGDTGGGDTGGGSGRRPLAPGDIAVLVRTNEQAAVVHSALRAASVPAVVAGTESVFSTPSALHWLRLLEALEQPASRPRAAAAALTSLVGMTAAQVASADEEQWEELHGLLHRWGDILRRRGLAALSRAVLDAGEVPRRLLSEASGERHLTDLNHVAQLLHAEANAQQMGLASLRAWLDRRVAGAGEETVEAEERSRRLDSDADAVQVLTVHRAKGLEFPVVYCPFLWDPSPAPVSSRPIVFHDESNAGRRTLDVGGTQDNPGHAQHLDAARAEQRGEDLRLLYVALTRARHQVVLWWARGPGCENSPLGRMLLLREPGGRVPGDGRSRPKDATVHEALEKLAARSKGHMSVETCTDRDAVAWKPQTAAAAPLLAARFERRLDEDWRRYSYTGITAGYSHAADGNAGEAVGSEPEEPGVTDEPAFPAGATTGHAPGGDGSPPGEETLRETPSLLGQMPGGREIGTFVHRVLEQVDFAAGDLRAEVGRVLAEQRSRQRIDIGPPDAAAAGLEAAISTPLGPLAWGRSLRSLGTVDRLDELGFELPLAGGDTGRGRVLVRDIAGLFARHADPEGPLPGYEDRLADPALAGHLRGFLTGSLDLVMRLRGDDGSVRYLVADYKTNRLASTAETLSAWHYRPAALGAEMQQAHYPLQAILYLVALHRYLRWRQRGYDPATHLGGVVYLFLRGMLGPSTPPVGGNSCGVFSWQPPTALVTDLSDLLERGSAR